MLNLTEFIVLLTLIALCYDDFKCVIRIMAEVTLLMLIFAHLRTYLATYLIKFASIAFVDDIRVYELVMHEYKRWHFVSSSKRAHPDLAVLARYVRVFSWVSRVYSR